MTPEGKVKKAFTLECVKHGIVPFNRILTANNPIGVIINLELFRIRGIPDKLVLLRGGRFELLEFKRDGGGLSDEQTEVLSVLQKLRVSIAIIEGEESARRYARHLAKWTRP